MAQKPPAFQFYAKDWNSSTTVSTMTMHDRGVYISLLSAAWDSDEPGTLPLPLPIAARSARISLKNVRQFCAKWPQCFVQMDGRLVNHKLRENWLNYNQIREKRVKAGQKRQSARAQQVLSPASASASASALSSSRKNKTKDKNKAFALPDWVPSDTWAAYLEMRQKIKKPATQAAMLLAVHKLETLSPDHSQVKAILEQSILSDWQSLYPIKEHGGNGHGFESFDERRARRIKENVDRAMADPTGDPFES